MLTLFLICFWVGVVLTVVITLFGGHHAHIFHTYAGHAHVDSSPSPFNLTSILSFITVFGGVGYILEKTSVISTFVIILLSLAAGLFIGFLFFLFFAKVIFKNDDSMKESDYSLQGQLGLLSVPIVKTGVGEMKYVLHGTTRSVSVRSEHGESIEKGRKVLVLRVEKGVAIVTEFENDVL